MEGVVRSNTGGKDAKQVTAGKKLKKEMICKRKKRSMEVVSNDGGWRGLL